MLLINSVATRKQGAFGLVGANHLSLQRLWVARCQGSQQEADSLDTNVPWSLTPYFTKRAHRLTAGPGQVEWWLKDQLRLEIVL
jgi:hypothetical protein